jgi:hypothetical protein
MATNHVITSELEHFLALDVWAKENLSKEEFDEFERCMSNGDFNLVNHVYDNWIVDQKITHQYTDIYDNPVTISYKDFTNV